MKLYPSLRVSAALGLVLSACGPSGWSEDADGDTISDSNEGRPDEVDTDLDDSPDYLDTDSDGDCVPDKAEAGDDDPSTPAVDTDGDGVDDFRDLDADADGLADGME